MSGEGRERAMVSREHKKAVLYEKLQLLRSITNSQAVILQFLKLMSLLASPLFSVYSLPFVEVYMFYKLILMHILLSESLHLLSHFAKLLLLSVLSRCLLCLSINPC